ncbi:MAG: hypothetical protein HY534_08515 [Chloroflexi bacterium]|nr:hypothetical protein [Chloroflexota bacterium]
MRPVLVEWSLVEAACTRAGWAAGWTVGVLVGVVGVASGGQAELSAVRAGAALVGFVLIGWITGTMVSRFAPPSTGQKPTVGAHVDRVVGDDVVWPEPQTAAGEAARGTNAA